MDFKKLQEDIKSIPSTTYIEEAMLLYGYIKALPLNATIVELGTGLGRTTIAMAYACIGTNRKIYTIDNYIQGDKFTKEVGKNWSEKEARYNVEKFKLQNYVKFFNCSTTDSNLILAIPTPIDFIFIDAGHSYNIVKKDIIFWKPHISKNGIMCGHDWSFSYPEGREVIKAVSEELLHKDYPFQVDYKIWKVRRYW